MNILSLFDGMSCGRLALDRASIAVDNYYASEIDKYAIQIAKKNYPDTQHIGDVCNVHAIDLPKIDLLIGGSPCQGFSFAGAQLAFDDPRSKLFFEYERLLKECEPEYFLLENVRMKKEFENIISRFLGVEPVMINSALVSAQNRVRLYWTNIPGVRQPEDRGILLEDILEDGDGIIHENFSKTKTKHYKKSCALRAGASANYQTVFKGRRKTPVIKNRGELIYKPHKSQCLDANYHKGADNHGGRTLIQVGSLYKNNGDAGRIYSVKGKGRTLKGEAGGGGAKMGLITEDNIHYRKLTPLECERLQTVPDGYTEGVSNTQRYRMLGNGWTIDVIAHIFENLYLLT